MIPFRDHFFVYQCIGCVLRIGEMFCSKRRIGMKKRIEEADYMKGVAILAVILIHVTAFSMRSFHQLTDGGVFFAINQLGRFCVPVFFMISGLFLFYRYYDNEPFPVKSFFKKRTMYILIPYLIWSVIYLIYGKMVHPETVPGPGIKSIEAIFTGGAYYHLYFLVVMVQFYVLLPVLIWAFRKFGGITVVAFSLLVNVIAGSMTWWEVVDKLPWLASYNQNAMYYFPVWLFYFCLGGWIGQHADQVYQYVKKIPFSATVLFYLASAVAMMIEGFVRKHTGFFNYSVFAYSICTLMLLYQMFCKWKFSWMYMLGKYSFGLYLIHPMLLNLWSQVSSKLFPAASWTEFFIMLFVVTLFSLGLAKLMKRLPYHYLITGK